MPWRWSIGITATIWLWLFGRIHWFNVDKSVLVRSLSGEDVVDEEVSSTGGGGGGGGGGPEATVYRLNRPALIAASSISTLSSSTGGVAFSAFGGVVTTGT
jgi:hypothetical protein